MQSLGSCFKSTVCVQTFLKVYGSSCFGAVEEEKTLQKGLRTLHYLNPPFRGLLNIVLYRLFLFYSIMERVRKGGDLPKKEVGVTEHPTKIFAHQVNAKVISSIFCRVFNLVRALENDVARVCLMNSVHTGDAVAMGANVLK